MISPEVVNEGIGMRLFGSKLDQLKKTSMCYVTSPFEAEEPSCTPSKKENEFIDEHNNIRVASQEYIETIRCRNDSFLGLV